MCMTLIYIVRILHEYSQEYGFNQPVAIIDRRSSACESPIYGSNIFALNHV